VNGKINQFLSDTKIDDDEQWHEVSEQKFKDIHHRFSELYEVHAEQNAIYNLIKTGASYDTDNLAIITTVEPCEQCAKAIAALGIKHVFYKVAYDRNTIDIPKYFSRLGIICRQVESSGEAL
jgi:deoxycytidylate deaminase